MTIPTIPPTTLQETLTDLLEATALEDAACANLIDAICEGHQYVTAHATSPEDVLKSQRQVERLMRVASLYQALVSLRQESIKELVERYT